MSTKRLPSVSTPRAAPGQDNRARLIRLVHVGRRELRLDEETYRAMLRAQGGESSAAMPPGQLQKVVDAMKTMGFKVSSKASPARHGSSVASRRSGGSAVVARSVAVVLASDPEARKARAMWLSLHAIGQVRDPSEAALLAYARRQTGVERMEWVRDMVPVLEPLKAWLLRSLPHVLTPFVREPVSAWAGQMDGTWRHNWSQAVERLKAALQRGNVQLVDEYVDLLTLVQATGANVSGGKK